MHHLRYDRVLEPWDYAPEDLLTVCEACHSYETTERRRVEQQLLEVLRAKGFSADDLNELTFTLESAVFCCEKREFVEFFDWMMIDGPQENYVRDYYDSGIPSEFLRANPGYEGRPVSNDPKA